MDDSLPATIQFVERLSHLTPEEKKLYMEMMGKWVLSLSATHTNIDTVNLSLWALIH